MWMHIMFSSAGERDLCFAVISNHSSATEVLISSGGDVGLAFFAASGLWSVLSSSFVSPREPGLGGLFGSGEPSFLSPFSGAF